ncbi:hypothetical protein H8S95_15420 [Pontibacter sp. KCTC 32443]|uniref:hypothetical protein n=1 Tax=Pontibacter TaxID=323449 RepID=UPI00164DBEF0|nr:MULTISPECIES: hypothetical protein [Pontibacter]MBC5775467.1 hypothetical protein [Pontibacter sp. KCTC 32443]
MKKLVYLLSSLMLVFTACDPMEDVYEELDKAKTSDKVTVSTELKKADYEVYSKDATVPHVAKNLYFVNEDEAAALIPAILDKNYPHLGNGASVNVTYNVLSYPQYNNTTSIAARVTVSNAEYTAMGKLTSNFTAESDIATYLATKYPTPQERQLVALTYKMSDANGTVTTQKDSFFYLNGAWKNIYHVSDAEYTATGNGQFRNFDSNSDALLTNYFNQFLTNYYTNNNLIVRKGIVEYVSFTYYTGSATVQRLRIMVYDGSKWVEAATAVEKASLKFKKKANVWEPDLSIPYAFVTADYAWIGDDANGFGTELNRKNLRDFGNFYQSNPNSTNYWSDEQIAAAIAARLDVLFPNAEVEQKYEVSFAAYKGGNITRTMVFIKGANGKFALYVD